MHNFINLRKLLLTESDFKSRLIEWGQKVKTKVVFDTFESTDIKTKRTVFVSYLYFNSDFKVNGSGNSKKEAEQDAAKNIFPEVFPEKNI
jgi:ribonuclease-3